MGKLYGGILIKKIREGTEGVICEEQCGFRRRRSGVDQVCEKF